MAIVNHTKPAVRRRNYDFFIFKHTYCWTFMYIDVSVEDTYLFNILNVLFLDLINLELYICHTPRVGS